MDPNEVRFTQHLGSSLPKTMAAPCVFENKKMNRNGKSKGSTILALDDLVNDIQSREDFVRFVDALSQDRQSYPDEWENGDLTNYFEALGAWVDDLDGYYRNITQPFPKKLSWQLFAKVLLAAKSYE